MKLIYQAKFEPCEEGGYTVTVPDLPGCTTEGDDLAEAISMGIDAASGWILDELEKGRKIPEPDHNRDIPLNEDEFISLLVLDIDA